jgi:glycosyltransferase involved in cell wall biosynthesis
MKICIVGGIFDATDAYKAKHAITPETTLVDGLRKLGVDVQAAGHGAFRPSDDYDIVHVHHIGKAALKMASERSKSLFVFTSHDGPLMNGYEKSIMRRTAYRYILGQADALVALSRKEARHLEIVSAAKTIRVIPNGIPAHVFQPESALVTPAQENGTHGPLEILYVGQLIELKGVDVLLKAFKKVLEKRDARLKLVYHNSLLEELYKRQAAELGIADSVVFVGSVPSVQLADWYRRADLVVLPSYAEALPSVVTESLLCGTPVVASDVGGIADQVDRFGKLVTPGDPVQLADAIDSVLRDRQHYRGLAGAMRQHALSTFAVEPMIQAHLSLYRDLLKARTQGTDRSGSWLDPLVRIAVRMYWARSRRIAG